MTPEERNLSEKRRRERNLAIALVLGALAVLFYAVTVVRMPV